MFGDLRESTTRAVLRKLELKGAFRKAMDLNEQLLEVMGEPSIGNSTDRSFNRDLSKTTCPPALLRTPPSSPMHGNVQVREQGRLGRKGEGRRDMKLR